MGDRQEIIALYAQGLSLREVGRAVGLSYERVRQVLEAAGIPRRRRSPLDRLKAQFAAKGCLSLAEAAALVGRSPRTIAQWVRRGLVPSEVVRGPTRTVLVGVSRAAVLAHARRVPTLSVAMRERWRDPAYRERMLRARRSPEYRARMSEAARRRWRTHGRRS